MKPIVKFRDELASFGFVQVSTLVLMDRRLSDSALRTYLILLKFAWNKEFCFPGLSKMATERGVGLRTIDRSIKVLVESGLISVERRGNEGEKGGRGTNIYWIEPLHSVYGKKKNPTKISDEAKDFCGLNCFKYEQEKEEEEIETNDVPVRIRDDRLVVSASAIAAGKEKTEKAREKRIKRRKQKEDRKKNRFKTKDGTSLKDIENLWKKEYRKKWGNIKTPKWTVEQKSIAKKLVNMYGGSLVSAVISYVILNWDELVDRFRLNGYPSIKMVFGFRETLFPEVERGKIESKRNKKSALEDDEYCEEKTKSPSLGWGDEGTPSVD